MWRGGYVCGLAEIDRDMDWQVEAEAREFISLLVRIFGVVVGA